MKEPTATNPELPLLRGDEQAACLLLEPSFITKHTLRLTCLFILTQSPPNLPTLLIILRHLKTSALISTTPPSIVNMADHDAQIVEFAGLSGASPEEVRISLTRTGYSS